DARDQRKEHDAHELCDLKLHSAADVSLVEIVPHRMVNNDRAPIREGLHRMPHTTRNNRHHAWLNDLRHTIDGELQLALDHVVDLLLRMVVVMHRRAARKIVMRKGHVRRVEVASTPARQTLNHTKLTRIDDWHNLSSFPTLSYRSREGSTIVFE